MNPADLPPCPLCGVSDHQIWSEDRRRHYLRCRECRLVFVPPEFYLTQDDERRVYDQHENCPEDLRYRKFLSRLSEPVLRCLKERVLPEPGTSVVDSAEVSDSPVASEETCDQKLNGMCGLDFGCGPGPTLSVMFREAGTNVCEYDPFYSPDASVLYRDYDFITLSEVIEHLYRPDRDLLWLWQRIRPQGVLGIMTKRVRDECCFETWHYKNDPTHVCFWSLPTFSWLARHWNAELQVPGDDVVLLIKPGQSEHGRRCGSP